MLTNYKQFETDRLILRPTNESDAEFIMDLLNTPKWIKNIGDRNIINLEAALTYIRTKCMPQVNRLGYGNYTVIRKSDNVKLGTCGLYDREGIEGVDIGFAFLPQFEKKGYAFESSNSILKAAIEEFKIKKLSGITIKENISSQKLLEKLGLKFEKLINIPNDDEELMLYVLPIKEEK